MGDERGGWKAPDTTLWREHLHAATMVGRVAAARTAVELGYGIRADPGPSGRLGHWRIAGIPDEVLALPFEAVGRDRGRVRAPGRGVLPSERSRRPHHPIDQEHEEEGELVGRWRAELAAAGWPVERLAASVDAAKTTPQPMSFRDARQVLSGGLGRRQRPREAKGVLPPARHRGHGSVPVRPGSRLARPARRQGARRPRDYSARRRERSSRERAFPRLGARPGDCYCREPRAPALAIRRPRIRRRRSIGRRSLQQRRAWELAYQTSSVPAAMAICTFRAGSRACRGRRRRRQDHNAEGGSRRLRRGWIRGARHRHFRARLPGTSRPRQRSAPRGHSPACYGASTIAS